VITLVAGPPCGGKTTYVRQNAGPHDAILDFDDIVEALTGDRYDRSPTVMRDARERWLRQLNDFTRVRATGRLWIVWTAPRRGDRGYFRGKYAKHGAMVIVVMASEAECLRRAVADRPPSWASAVREWFAVWEPSRSGQERIVHT
jgi:hypothetical protein